MQENSFRSESPEKAPLISKEALDFAPGLLSIQECPPARLPRVILYCVGILFFILLLWATFGKLDIIASAEGRLVPQTFVKIVQPADSGIVQQILVKEGDAVKAGQVILRMDTKIADADSKTIQTERALRALQLRRIDAELSGTPLVSEASDPPDLFAQVASQYHDRHQNYLDAIAQQRQMLLKSQEEFASGKEVLGKLQQTTPILQEQAQSYHDLGKDGYVARVMVADKEKDYLEHAQDLRAQKATVASLQAAVEAAKMQLDQITSKYRSDLRNERVDAQEQFEKLDQEWVKQQRKTDLLELKAPQSGIVKDLAVHTVGTVVSPGMILLSLVPENEPLVAEVMVKNDDVGFVFPKQKVKIKIAAYPFEKYGMLDGEVLYVGADASDNSSQNTSGREQVAESGDKSSQQLAYKATIGLKNQVLAAQGEQFHLVPGMEVVAEIDQGKRTVMEYLLSPVRKVLHDGGRER